MLGLPNVGKSTLFGRLVGPGSRTANALGTSQEACSGCVSCAPAGGSCGSCGTDAAPDERSVDLEITDLPGVYNLQHDTPEARVCRDTLAMDAHGEVPVQRPDALLVVIEAMDLGDGLRLLRTASRAGLPVVVAVSMIDEARRAGVEISEAALAERLGCPVVPVSARRSTGIERLRDALASDRARPVHADLSEGAIASMVRSSSAAAPRRGRAVAERLTDRFDDLATHPVLGLGLLVALLGALLWAVLRASEIPGGWLESALGAAGAWVASSLPGGFLSDLLGNGVIAGVGGVVVFVPQIFATFVVLALLEHTGYLSRAMLAADRLLRPFGLSGRAFMPMLTSYGCAIPAVIAARSIPCKRERLATILAIPFMGCPARVPVYILVAAAIFPGSALMRTLAIGACYAVGVAAALFTALVVRGTVARGTTAPFIVELPPFRRPSLREACEIGVSRSGSFLKRAGTLILGATVVMWTLENITVGTSPTPQAAPAVVGTSAEAPAAAAPPRAEPRPAGVAERTDAEREISLLGAAGRAAQPAFAPLGFDDRLTVAVLASFAARELFVSSMAVQNELDPDETDAWELRRRITAAERADGTPVFNTPTSWAVLIFFALSTQCLSTLAITARETRSWGVAAGQFAWAFLLAYALAFAAHALLSL